VSRQLPDPRSATVPRRVREDRGQASLEYIAVVAVVALVLVVAGAAVAAPSIVNGVGHGFQQALCSVTGEDCATVVPKPCVVRAAGTDVNASVKLTFVKLGRTTALLRAVSSDGSVTLTLMDNVDAGLTAGVGADGHLQVGGVDLSTGATAQLGAVARLGGGRTWKVADAAAADRLQRKLIEVIVGRTGSTLPVVGPVLHLAQKLLDVGSGRDLPRPVSRTLKGKVSVSATVKGPFGTELQAAAGVALGATQNLVDGGGTVLLDLDGGVSAAIAGGLGGLGIGGGVGVHVTLDRHGRPTLLALVASGRLDMAAAAKAKLPGTLSAGDTRQATAEITASLDLTVPANLAVARRLLRALSPGHHDDLSPAAGALAELVAQAGRLEVTRYGRHEHKIGAGAQAGLGAEAAFDVSLTRSDAELLDAWTRPGGGLWERRADCLAVA
jgi:hypothetical protein